MDDKLIEILACPLCKTAVRPADQKWDALVCDACGRRYPVEDGIPMMIVEAVEAVEATEATESEDEPGRREQ